MPKNRAAAVKDHEKWKSGFGLRMTLLYSLAYLGFMMLSVFRPEWMGDRALFGMNLAVTYGIGLILLAIVMAIVYNQLCKNARTSKGGK